MNLKIATALCLLLLCLPIGAQKKNINAAWEFQRLNRTQRQVEIKNQGSDWSSQYNIEHVSQQSKGLTVPSDTLRDEFALLAVGQWDRVSLPHTPSSSRLSCCISGKACAIIASNSVLTSRISTSNFGWSLREPCIWLMYG